MSSRGVKQVTTENFDENVSSQRLAVVKFGASWCGPCRALAPILEELAMKYGDRVDFVEVDVDQNPDLAARFSVRGIPAVFYLKNEKVVESFVGLHAAQNYTHSVEKHL